jgi:hypothetical protein
MLRHYRRALAAVGATVTAGAVAVSGVAASAATAHGGPHLRTGASAVSLPKITVAMNGTSVRVGGTLQSGGATIISTVTKEPGGNPTFIRLEPGISYARFFQSFKKVDATGDPNELDGIASIVVDAAAPRGTSWVQAYLKPGKYVAFDTAGNNPAKWPQTTFTITQASSPATLPTPQASVRAIEFGFRGARELHEGELVRFANSGFLVHMIVAARARNLTDARKLARLLKTGNDRRAERLAVGFATFAGPLSHGAYQQLKVTARPGYWVLACFMDTQDGREHTQLGMVRVIHIVN